MLQKTVDTVTEKPIPFDIDIEARTSVHRLLQKWNIKPRKRYFVLKPLTLAQLQRISGLLLSIDKGNLSADDILKLMQHADKVATIIAVAVTPSREEPPKELIKFFLRTLNRAEMTKLLNIVLSQMDVLNFILSITSIRSLNILETQKPASVIPVNRSEVNPMEPVSQIAPRGVLSVAS